MPQIIHKIFGPLVPLRIGTDRAIYYQRKAPYDHSKIVKKIAYLVNVYPAPSHSFIRREILALEDLGWQVARVSVRRTDSPLHDAGDQREASKTEILLEAGLLKLAMALLMTACFSPIRFLQAKLMAWKLGRRSDRGLLYHGVYLAEACLLKRRLAHLGIEHVHAHFGSNSTTVALLCHILGGPHYSFTVHGPEEFDKATILGLEQKIHLASFVVAISQFGRSQLYRWSRNEDWSKIHVVHCGLDASYLARTQLPASDSRQLVCVGRLCEQKGQLLLVEALGKLLQAGAIAKLVLVGDGPMRAEIESRIHVLQIQDHVRFTGWASGETVQNELSKARVLVLPSFAEGLPVVIMEAMAIGRPVISTYVAGIPELVIPGENGWLVPAGDVQALVTAMRDAIDTPVQRLQEMGANGRQRVLERHDIRKEVRKLADLMEQPAAQESR